MSGPHSNFNLSKSACFLFCFGAYNTNKIWALVLLSEEVLLGLFFSLGFFPQCHFCCFFLCLSFLYYFLPFCRGYVVEIASKAFFFSLLYALCVVPPRITVFARAALCGWLRPLVFLFLILSFVMLVTLFAFFL